MIRDRTTPAVAAEAVISIIGPGMSVTGDCTTDGTLRIEGRIEGTVRAGKAVVVGRDGVIEGNILTQDAVIGGHVRGSVQSDSRLEVQATARIEGEVRARRIQVEEGAVINGTVNMGDGGPSVGSHTGQGTLVPEFEEL